MKEAEVKARAFAMPLTSPAYPPGPYRFVNREFMIITYRTDPDKLRAVVPEPLEVDEPLVKYEFIRMPDSTGFGDYTETGQVIPVRFRGRKGGYSHCMFLNDEPPIAGGRELRPLLFQLVMRAFFVSQTLPQRRIQAQAVAHLRSGTTGGLHVEAGHLVGDGEEQCGAQRQGHTRRKHAEPFRRPY